MSEKQPQNIIIEHEAEPGSTVEDAIIKHTNGKQAHNHSNQQNAAAESRSTKKRKRHDAQSSVALVTSTSIETTFPILPTTPEPQEASILHEPILPEIDDIDMPLLAEIDEQAVPEASSSVEEHTTNDTVLSISAIPGSTEPETHLSLTTDTSEPPITSEVDLAYVELLDIPTQFSPSTSSQLPSETTVATTKPLDDYHDFSETDIDLLNFIPVELVGHDTSPHASTTILDRPYQEDGSLSIEETDLLAPDTDTTSDAPVIEPEQALPSTTVDVPASEDALGDEDSDASSNDTDALVLEEVEEPRVEVPTELYEKTDDTVSDSPDTDIPLAVEEETNATGSDDYQQPQDVLSLIDEGDWDTSTDKMQAIRRIASKNITTPLATDEITSAESRQTLPTSNTDLPPIAAVPGYDETMLDEQPLQDTPDAIVDTPSSQSNEKGQVAKDLSEAPEIPEIIVTTPLTGTVEQQGAETSAAPTKINESISILPIPAQPSIKTRPVQKKRTDSVQTIVAYVLLALLLSTAFLLWQDFTTTHVYVNTLDARNGSIRSQQDIGSYQDAIAVTAPSQGQTSTFVGIHNDNPDNTQHTQQVLALNGGWQVAHQFPASLTHGSVSVTPNNDVIVENASGMQVFTSNGQLLWQLQANQPARGLHYFQPISDGTTLYTFKSAASSQIAAYDLQHGNQLWMQTLNDSVDYSAPLIIDDNMLYVASDHNIYALNRSDGTFSWQKSFPARTLLLENDVQTHLLVATGAQGVMAFNPTTGVIAWTFTGQPSSTLTPPQFYQGVLGKTASSNDQIVYTTGIVWQMPQVQEQVWLYALDVPTGTLLWSQHIASGMVGADAGRLFVPLLDTAHDTVVLQQQIDRNSQRIQAFDANNGAPRWNRLLTGITNSAPALFNSSHDALVLLTTGSDIATILRTLSIPRLIMIALTGLTAIVLLLLCLLSMRRSLAWLRHTMGRLSHYILYPIKRLARLRYASRRTIALVLFVLLIALSVPGYSLLTSPQNRIYQLSASTGIAEWKHTTTTPTQLLTADTQGSIVVTSTGSNLHQLQALDRNGKLLWKMFNSEGTFSLPANSSQPGTLLIALTGHAPFAYQFAPDDPAYPRALDHMLALYLLDRHTGATLWQRIIVYPDEQQNPLILGADKSFIYVASSQTTPIPDSPGSTVQLFGVDQATGIIDWRVFGPALPTTPQHDDGKLLLNGNLAIWQVAGNIYAIDTAVGQIAWRHTITNGNPSILIQEEQHMAETSNLLLITRGDGVHALDLASGDELWTLTSSDTSNTQAPTSVVATNHTIVTASNGQLHAFDVTNQHLLWSKTHLGTIQTLNVADDGTMLYVQSSGQDHAPQIAAFDMQTGVSRWTFSPSEQVSFIQAAPASFLHQAGRLYLGACSPSESGCTPQHLYVLNASTGQVLWKFTGGNISSIQLSQDGTLIAFSTTRSLWTDIISRFTS